MLIGFCIKRQLPVSPQGGAEMMLMLWYFIDDNPFANLNGCINDFCDQACVCFCALTGPNLANDC